MTYVLIIILHAFGVPPAITTAEFNDRQSCLNALRTAYEMKIKHSRLDGFCAAKGPVDK